MTHDSDYRFKFALNARVVALRGDHHGRVIDSRRCTPWKGSDCGNEYLVSWDNGRAVNWAHENDLGADL